MPETILPEIVLVGLRRTINLSIRENDFVDPHAVHRLRVVIRNRGEQWAASVLGRPLDRRSLIDASMPWLGHREVHILVAADSAEDAYAAEKIGE